MGRGVSVVEFVVAGRLVIFVMHEAPLGNSVARRGRAARVRVYGACRCLGAVLFFAVAVGRSAKRRWCFCTSGFDVFSGFAFCWLVVRWLDHRRRRGGGRARVRVGNLIQALFISCSELSSRWRPADRRLGRIAHGDSRLVRSTSKSYYVVFEPT